MAKILFALAVALMLPAASALAQAEGTSKKSHHCHFARKHQAGCPIHLTAEGDPVDCHGWRYRSNIGWDNTCLNLDYLPSEFACSMGTRR